VSEVYVPPGGPPQQGPSKDVYDVMGRENIYRMMKDFYAELEQSELRGMFPEDMVEASRRSAAFFVQLLGGPPLYNELYGPPMMRRRHLPFAIDEHARQVWLGCFKKVLEKADTYAFPPEHLQGFVAFLDAFSGWMVSRKSPG
jgi:hemoglobin